MEAVFAGGHYRGLKLQDGLITEACGVGQVARYASDGSNQALVRIEV
jgi:hypothetical protein